MISGSSADWANPASVYACHVRAGLTPSLVPAGSMAADMGFIRDICAYWRHRFDWKAQVGRMSELHRYRYDAVSTEPETNP